MTKISIIQFLRRPRASNYSIERVYSDVRRNAPKDIEIRTWVCSSNRFRLITYIWDVVRAAFANASVLHVTGDVHFLLYGMSKRKTILTVHDCATLERLKGFRRLVYWLLWFYLPVRHARYVVAVSEHTKQKLLKFVSCREDKVQVIRNPVSDAFFLRRSLELPMDQPRLLQIGTKKNKNLERVALAIQGLDCTLVVIGSLTDEQKRMLKRLNVRLENFSNLSESELIDQYLACTAVVFASTYEGFGLPIIEAQAIGRAVVTSSIEPMISVAKDGACFVDPFDVNSIRTGILRVVQDETYRLELISRGLLNAEQYRSDVVSAEYFDLYRKIVKTP